MSRRKRDRKVLLPPVINGMSVCGVRGRKFQEINLGLDEFETIRLLDYRGLTQEEAAVLMEVSRPTLTRIYERARQKMASALVEGRGLRINGGNFFFEDNWYKCKSCKAGFNICDNNSKLICPICSSADLSVLTEYYKEKENNLNSIS